jgi:hypothetical protein
LARFARLPSEQFHLGDLANPSGAFVDRRDVFVPHELFEGGNVLSLWQLNLGDEQHGGWSLWGAKTQVGRSERADLQGGTELMHSTPQES